MLLGIDVGGTFTDAVAAAPTGEIVAQAKSPTTHSDLLEGILAALDEVLTEVEPDAITRVALSTTIVTNAVVEGKTDPVGLIIMPGPGMDPAGRFPSVPATVSGYIDHRGREVTRPAEDEVKKAVGFMADNPVFAVAGKFSVRNPAHELQVAEWIKEVCNPRHIAVSSAISGELNFPRRANSAYFNAAVWRRFQMFAQAIAEGLRRRGISAPVHILKADGGTLPLSVAQSRPVEAVFTGPAASVLGIMALHRFEEEAVSLDIGGTTTDIALWRDGTPVFASRGAMINGYPTSVRSFWLRSVGIGGDSQVRREDGVIKVGPARLGPAMALGGPVPTVSDAMIVCGLSVFGNAGLAEKAMSQVAAAGQTAREAAQAVLAAAAEAICQTVAAMIEERAAQPVYRVEDIIRGEKLHPRLIVGVGGAACGLAPFVAEKLGIACVIPDGAMVANALGAAAARPTLELTLRADTAQGYYTLAEFGLKHALSGKRFSMDDAFMTARRHLALQAQAAGISADDIELVYQEEFNVIRGFSTMGKILTCKVQIKPGVSLDAGRRDDK